MTMHGLFFNAWMGSTQAMRHVFSIRKRQYLYGYQSRYTCGQYPHVYICNVRAGIPYAYVVRLKLTQPLLMWVWAIYNLQKE